jgi:hypothetical protein
MEHLESFHPKFHYLPLDYHLFFIFSPLDSSCDISSKLTTNSVLVLTFIDPSSWLSPWHTHQVYYSLNPCIIKRFLISLTFWNLVHSDNADKDKELYDHTFISYLQLHDLKFSEHLLNIQMHLVWFHTSFSFDLKKNNIFSCQIWI